MTEESRKTFRETPLPDDVRQNIINTLREEDFSEEQLNEMVFQKVWNLYVDSVTKILSDEVGELARAFERNPQLASMFNPPIKRITQELENSAKSMEEELDKKKEKKGRSC
jgi:transcriptional regulator NrdR family protein